MQWWTLFQKELIENVRNVKWIWVPLIMILIAIMDPLTNYYLPQIIEAVGGMPEGAEVQLPEYQPDDVVMMSLGQFSTIGVLTIALISMGTIAGERNSGVSELILVKPVSYMNYITAKWASLALLVLTAFALGMAASWYYINILYGDLSFGALLQVLFFYGLWLTLVISLSIFYNTLFKTPGIVAFLTLATIILMGLITTIFSHVLEWSPNYMSDYIQQMLITGSVPGELIGTAGVTIILVILLVFGSASIFKNKELAG
ncbi:ABC-2 type transport system permease protein [Lentibacillus halodurans]|uniref:ABC-2 type transport system permease protein n=1 Tax=Lentibacillus halodurans TaxID=237679 RepID=A0A1I0YU33_9BACI|nr:ABC transporter permease subunit [Lentibacillus halodurans]SFB16722.1 ABC-2 type transport system permease protein [Lentibacillus halodurans]